MSGHRLPIGHSAHHRQTATLWLVGHLVEASGPPSVNLIGQYLLSEIHEVSSPASHGASSPFSSRDSISRYRFTNHMIYAIKGRLSMTLTRYVHMLSLLPRTCYHNQGWGMRDRDFQQYTILFPKPYLTIHMNLYTYFDTLVSYETKCDIAPDCLCNQPYLQSTLRHSYYRGV